MIKIGPLGFKLKMIALVGGIIVAFITGMRVEGWRNDSAELDIIDARNTKEKYLRGRIEDLSFEVAKREDEKNQLKLLFAKEQQRETQKIIYRKCIVPIDGVQLYNRAAKGLTSAASDGVSAMQ